MTTLVLIHAVPWDEARAANARALRRATSATIVWDTTHENYDTYLAALAYQGSRDAIHLEDDVQLTSDWRAKAEAAIDGHRDGVVQMFSRRAADLTVGSRREPGANFLHNHCFYLPGRLAPGLRAFAAIWPERHTMISPSDNAMAAYLAAEGESYWLHVPSLVQHLPWRSAVSPSRSAHRQSETFQPLTERHRTRTGKPGGGEVRLGKTHPPSARRGLPPTPSRCAVAAVAGWCGGRELAGRRLAVEVAGGWRVVAGGVA